MASKIWLTPRQAADHLGLHWNTLGRWRYLGFKGQPKYYKRGAKCVRYLQDELDAWLLQSSQRTPGSKHPSPALAE